METPKKIPFGLVLVISTVAAQNVNDTPKAPLAAAKAAAGGRLSFAFIGLPEAVIAI